MNPSIRTVTKLLIQKSLPDTIIYQIIRLFYHEEHQQRLIRCFEGIMEKAFRNLRVCHADLESAVLWYYQCNCCERHSYNKAVIRDDDLIIVTKPCVFKAWRYDTEGPYRDCDCNCRNMGRSLARAFLKKKNPVKPFGYMMRNANGTHRPLSLGIRNSDHGPDPDDPAYYDYMVEHHPHLVNHH
jgi:hypothetical protein